MKLDSYYEAFVFGLLLAIDAPTEEKSEQALELAESIAEHLTADQVEQAKADVIDRLDLSKGGALCF